MNQVDRNLERDELSWLALWSSDALWPNDMRVCQILHTGGGNLNAGKGGI
jgi:hypothetical protein